MTPDRWADLRARAAEATPGLWEVGTRRDGSHWMSAGDPVRGPHYQGDIIVAKRDAAYIAAASPDVVKKLLAEHDALRAVLTACRHELYDLSHSSGDPSDPANMESTAMLYREVCAALAAGEDAP